MKKLLLLILLLIFSQADAQIRRADINTIGEVDSIEIGGRWFNIGSFNDSTENKTNSFSQTNTFEKAVTFDDGVTFNGQVIFNNRITANDISKLLDTFLLATPSNLAELRMFSRDADSIFRWESNGLKGFTINPVFNIRNAGASILWTPTASPTANRTKFIAHDFQSILIPTANNQTLINVRTRGSWSVGGFTGTNKVIESWEQEAGGVSTMRVLNDNYVVTFLLDKLGTHSVDFGPGRLVIVQDGDSKSSISFVHDGNPAEGATYDTTDIIDLTMNKSPQKVLYSTGNLGLRYDSLAYYWGFAGDNGTWREKRQGDSILTQRLETGVWNTKAYTTASVSGVNTGFSINTTTDALIVPRMDSTQRDALTPVAGMIIFNTTTNKHQGYDGSGWNDFY